jgi:hypothetical protein
MTIRLLSVRGGSCGTATSASRRRHSRYRMRSAQVRSFTVPLSTSLGLLRHHHPLEHFSQQRHRAARPRGWRSGPEAFRCRHRVDGARTGSFGILALLHVGPSRDPGAPMMRVAAPWWASGVNQHMVGQGSFPPLPTPHPLVINISATRIHAMSVPDRRPGSPAPTAPDPAHTARPRITDLRPHLTADPDGHAHR